MSWSDAKAQIKDLNVPSVQFANALDLISAAASIPAPRSATLGPYDGGISLHWVDRELAVFADRYETYTFSAGDTVIHHWPHEPGEVVDPAMLLEMVAG